MIKIKTKRTIISRRLNPSRTYLRFSKDLISSDAEYVKHNVLLEIRKKIIHSVNIYLSRHNWQLQQLINESNSLFRSHYPSLSLTPSLSLSLPFSKGCERCCWCHIEENSIAHKQSNRSSFMQLQYLHYLLSQIYVFVLFTRMALIANPFNISFFQHTYKPLQTLRSLIKYHFIRINL